MKRNIALTVLNCAAALVMLGGCFDMLIPAVPSNLLAYLEVAEAEPLLLSSYEGMKQREDKFPAASKENVKETLQRLVHLYETTSQPDKTVEWNKKLTELDKAEAEKKTAAPKPQHETDEQKPNESPKK